jgi:hypothetical protein
LPLSGAAAFYKTETRLYLNDKYNKTNVLHKNFTGNSEGGAAILLRFSHIRLRETKGNKA